MEIKQLEKIPIRYQVNNQMLLCWFKINCTNSRIIVFVFHLFNFRVIRCYELPTFYFNYLVRRFQIKLATPDVLRRSKLSLFLNCIQMSKVDLEKWNRRTLYTIMIQKTGKQILWNHAFGHSDSHNNARKWCLTPFTFASPKATLQNFRTKTNRKQLS